MNRNHVPVRLPPLPIDEYLPSILRSLTDHQNLVLIASPGAGKTTRLPPALVRSDLFPPPNEGILMLEPRRLAARAAAARIAVEQEWTVGEEVGYQVRFENRTSRATRLCVMTEGLLNRRLARDPQLSGIGCVILDEFHERNWHSDLGLGLLRELQLLARPDLKIIVMSATLHAERISSFLGDAPIIDVKATVHPITLHHDREPQLLLSGPPLIKRVEDTIRDVLAGHRPGAGDILVFLPGSREISAVQGRLQGEARALGIELHPLHGSLRLEDQDRAVRRSSQRKVILATNIAESSVTIDGVATVIDSGLARLLRQDANGFARLELSRISRFSAIQRTGRAGRQGPGFCHRLWNKMDEASMNESEAPEIQRVDLAEACLLLASQGVSDLRNFSWFEKPPADSLQAALKLLILLGAFKRESDERVSLNELGRRLLEWPLHPRLAKLMEAAIDLGGSIPKASRIAALLSEKDILLEPGALKHTTDLESDVLLRLEALEASESRSGSRIPTDPAATALVKRATEQIQRIAKGRMGQDRARSTSRMPFSLFNENQEQQLLLLAFPDRIARRRRQGDAEARMVGGKGLRLARQSCVTQSELFLALDAVTITGTGSAATGKGGVTPGDPQVTIASRIERSWLERFFPDRLREERTAVFDQDSGRIAKKIIFIYDDLPLEDPRWAEASDEDAARLLPSLISSRWSSLLERNENASRWLARFEFLRATCPEKNWPDVQLRDAFDPQTREIIEAICMGENTIAAIFAKDLTYHFESLLDRSAGQSGQSGQSLVTLLRSQALDSITVPSGSRIRINYPSGQAPFIEVRIQEIFGWTESPTLAEGRTRLVLHLLGPNFRPVQVTSDLRSFWQTGYTDVRKELRARYPKHSWPEDPTTAKAEAKGGPRRR